MAKDTKPGKLESFNEQIVNIVTELSELQNQMYEEGSDESISFAKQLGEIMSSLLSHLQSTSKKEMDLNDESEIDYLVLAAETEIDTGFRGTLPDGKYFSYRVSSAPDKLTWRMLTLFDFSRWVHDDSMQKILTRVFKGKKFISERPMNRDSDIMHFMESTE